jgi:hypothetical protein
VVFALCFASLTAVAFFAIASDREMDILRLDWIFYTTVVAGIYAISSKASDIFNPDTINNAAVFARTYSVGGYLQDVNDKTKRLIDKLFCFGLWGFVYLPSLKRTALLSLLNLLVIGFLAELVVYYKYPGELSPSGYVVSGLSGIINQRIFWSVTLIWVIITNFVSDFLSFTKTRTVLQFVGSQENVAKIVLLYALDLILSGLIPIILTVVMIRVSEYLIYNIILDAKPDKGLGSFLVDFVVYRAANSVAIISFSTSLFIFFCGLVIGFLNSVVILIQRAELLRNVVIRHLNFDNKPNIALGVLAILIFSVVYWLLIVFATVLKTVFHFDIDILGTIFSLVLLLVEIIGLR